MVFVDLSNEMSYGAIFFQLFALKKSRFSSKNFEYLLLKELELCLFGEENI